MYQNNSYVATGTSYGDFFCGNGVNSTQTVTVSANVTDSVGQSKSGSQVTTIHYSGSTSGGCFAPDSSGKTSRPIDPVLCP